MDFWTEIGLNRPVHIMITPMMKNSKILKGFRTEMITENVQDLINNEQLNKPSVENRKGQVAKMTWDDYYSYNEVRFETFFTKGVFTFYVDS